jgi:Ca2+-binding RTX toxin-like protein
MRRAVALAVLAALACASGAAAVKRAGTPGDDRMVGTKHADIFHAQEGDDVLRGNRGPDRLVGGRGYDRLHGGRGNDLIDARRGDEDLVDCGPGKDVVVVDDAEDGVFDCETVQYPSDTR